MQQPYSPFGLADEGTNSESMDVVANGVEVGDRSEMFGQSLDYA